MSDENAKKLLSSPRRDAFTLIELMVVIFIIGVLVALVVGVGRYVYDEAGRKETQTILATVEGAIDAYREIVGTDPEDSITTGGGDLQSIQALVFQLRAEEAETQTLARKIQNACGPILLELPSDSYAIGAGGQRTIRDAFGNELVYDEDAGFGGRPLLVSPGPDGAPDTEDDIRSDR